MSSPLSSSVRAALGGAALLLAVAAPGAAQTTAAAPAPPAAAAAPLDLAGSWTGEYFIAQGQGPMAMTFAKADSGWGGTVEVTTPERTMKSAIGTVTVDGSAVTFTAVLDGADVTFRATFQAGELAGKLVAIQNGNTVAEGDWSAHHMP